MKNPVRSLLLLACMAAPLFAEQRTPVLVELFTSEGCSSCPPADRLLIKLHEEQPIRGVDVIVLSEHVDYWNRLGWFDRFSSPEYGKRQSWYSSRWPTRVYTPQVVVDGEREAVGGDGPSVVRLIREATLKKKGVVAMTRQGAELRLEVSGLRKPRKSKLMLAIVEDRLESDVSKGENRGRLLRHAGVVRSLIEVGELGRSDAEWSGSIPLRLDESWNRANLRAVAFVQQTASRAVVAIDALPLDE